jgi:hypothetical protein
MARHTAAAALLLLLCCANAMAQNANNATADATDISNAELSAAAAALNTTACPLAAADLDGVNWSIVNTSCSGALALRLHQLEAVAARAPRRTPDLCTRHTHPMHSSLLQDASSPAFCGTCVCSLGSAIASGSSRFAELSTTMSAAEIEACTGVISPILIQQLSTDGLVALSMCDVSAELECPDGSVAAAQGPMTAGAPARAAPAAAALAPAPAPAKSSAGGRARGAVALAAAVAALLAAVLL